MVRYPWLSSDILAASRQQHRSYEVWPGKVHARNLASTEHEELTILACYICTSLLYMKTLLALPISLEYEYN